MKKTGKLRKNLIFVNGTYQLMVGIACAHKYLMPDQGMSVILYDMQWQEELRQTAVQFCEGLNCECIKIPLEFQKSNQANTATYPIRAFLNHLLFWYYCRKYGGDQIFLPKPYGSPERAIIFASLKRKVLIYEDGFGMYLDPAINENRIDWLLYRWFKTIFQNYRWNIGLYPRRPEGLTYQNFHNFEIGEMDYTHEVIEIVNHIADMFRERIIQKLHREITNRDVIIVCLPRLSFAAPEPLTKQLNEMIHSISQVFPDVVFFLKPHPRDVNHDFACFRPVGEAIAEWDFLPQFVWCFPIEVIAVCIKPVILLSGYSTVGINEDLVSCKVMIYDFLSFNITYYNEHAKNLMKNFGTYCGDTIQHAIQAVIEYLNQHSR